MNSGLLQKRIGGFSRLNVAVIGDLMLDVYTWGRATRISPEAPVPVVCVKSVTNCPGGAANVMRNIVSLGGKAFAFGFCGNDSDGQILCGHLRDAGVNCSGILTDPDRRTTRKQRVMAGTQQLLRIDEEDTKPASRQLRERMTGEIIDLIRKRLIQAVIFEDYNKGTLETAMVRTIANEASRYGVITALDPKPGNLSPIPGLSVIKPNRSEAIAMAQCGGYVADTDQIASILLKNWQPDQLLISLAAEGLALYRKDGSKTQIPTHAREVFDVSGAGDTLVSAFTLSLAAGATSEEAAEIGNHAAGIVVGKLGTALVSADELIKELQA